ncbi:response regulator transcription factor [Clostridium subterminale]|uniref:Stage 0 sporulation protein A homolog n=1 Tax=Clostridium subterminale TaxID=1550 RepID=A0ABP3W3C5_CLOSU
MQVDILIVEDEVKILEVLEAYLKKAGYSVITAINGSEAIYKYKQYNPRLIILDLMLPDITGEKICEIIRKESEVPIIMLTAKVEEESILECFSLGTDDYITKPFSPKQVVARVNAVLKRALNYKRDNVLSFNKGNLVINLDTYEVRHGNNLIELTPSEFKILLALCESPKKVFTRGELLDRALGDDSDVYDRIIDSHIKNLRSKIEDNSKNPKYILTVHGIGYKFGGE